MMSIHESAGSGMPALFDAVPDAIQLAGGLPDLSAFPAAELGHIAADLLRIGGRVLMQYGTEHVPPALGAAIVDLMERRAVEVEVPALIPTPGSQLGLLAVALQFAHPGAAVLCQTPTYPGALAAFRTAGLTVVAVPNDGAGPDPEVIRHIARTCGDPALLYLNPTFNNPTGRSLSIRRQEALLEAAGHCGLVVIDDDPYALLSFSGKVGPAMRSMAPERVIHLGTFSKIFAPGLRCGWIDAPQRLREELRTVVQTATLSPSPLAQALLGRFHARFGWDRLLTDLRHSYARRAAELDAALTAYLDPTHWRWDQPDGGFYIWLRQADGCSATPVAQAAATHGVLVLAGQHFSIGGKHLDGIRLSFSSVPFEHIREAARRLAAAAAAMHQGAAA